MQNISLTFSKAVKYRASGSYDRERTQQQWHHQFYIRVDRVVLGDVVVDVDAGHG